MRASRWSAPPLSPTWVRRVTPRPQTFLIFRPRIRSSPPLARWCSRAIHNARPTSRPPATSRSLSPTRLRIIRPVRPRTFLPGCWFHSNASAPIRPPTPQNIRDWLKCAGTKPPLAPSRLRARTRSRIPFSPVIYMPRSVIRSLRFLVPARPRSRRSVGSSVMQCPRAKAHSPAARLISTRRITPKA